MYLPPDDLLAADARLREHYNLHVRELARVSHADHDLRIQFPIKYLAGLGLEIGALHSPVPLPQGVLADYLDHCDAATLRSRFEVARKHYCVYPILVEGDASVAGLADAQYDFLVANHVLEHCENPIETLRAHLRIVKPGGRLMYALPDMRHTFDRHRALTTFDHLLDDFRNGPSRNRREHLVDYFGLVDGLEGEALAAAVADYMGNGRDIHFHTWTLVTFHEHFQRAVAMGLFDAELLDYGQNGTEFVVVLEKPLGRSRR